MKNKRKIHLIVYVSLMVGLTFFPVSVYAETNKGVVKNYPVLAEIVRKTETAYPSLKRFDSEIDALREKKVAVSSWEDPMLHLKLMNVPTDSFRFNQEAMTQKKIGISQKIYAPGKLEHREKVVSGKISERKMAKRVERNRIVGEISQHYFALSNLQVEKRLIKDSQRLLRQFIRIAQKKYEVGKGNQTNIIEAKVQLAKFKSRLISIDIMAEEELQGILRYDNTNITALQETPENLFYSRLLTVKEEIIANTLRENPRLGMLDEMKNIEKENINL
ncbi:MAG: TolC family protein, partial [Nitrospinae bacterium]|nr:TolC family protein [Nitrospinota bacterium]